MEFANPALLLGGLLFVVPLLIHLLNRRQYRPMRWAAMDFLLAAYRKTRRRLRLENLLLLLLRCLLIVLLAAAMARPFTASSGAAAALVRPRRDVVVVLDTSYSMGYRVTPDETCFDRARRRIDLLLAGLDAGRGDTATLILMGPVPEFAAPYQSTPEEVRTRMERIREPSLHGADFAALAELLAGEVSDTIEGPKEVYVFTDLQARTFRAGGAQAAVAALLAKAGKRGAALRIVDVGPRRERPPNRAVTGLSAMDPLVITDAPVTFVARMRNFSDVEAPECRGAFLLDGEILEERALTLPASAEATAECTVRIPAAGPHSVAFRLEGDGLPVDDTRYHAFRVRDRVQVLLVDGDPGKDPVESAAGALAGVINPARIGGGTDRGTAFEPVTVDWRLFNAGKEEVNRYDVVILCGVEGGSLVIIAGERVDLQTYDRDLFSGGADRILPVRLEEVLGGSEGKEGTRYYKLVIEEPVHPALSFFEDPRYRPLLAVPFFRIVRTAAVPKDVRLLARFEDLLGNAYPALVERTLGRGKVILFTSSPAPSWSLLSESPVTFLPLVHGLLHYLAAPAPSALDLAVGDVIRSRTAEPPDRITLTDPAGNRIPVTEPVERDQTGRYLLPLESRPLDRAGVYKLEAQFDLSGRTRTEFYGANVDTAEGDLARIAPEAFSALFPGAGVVVTDSADAEAGTAEEGAGKGEFWKPILAALIALAAFELLLSWKFGSYR